MGEYTRKKLEQLKSKHPIIDHVRGIGLMIGIGLDGPGADIVSKCLEKGLRINCTHDTVLRFMPSMTVTEAQIDEAVGILDTVMTETETMKHFLSISTTAATDELYELLALSAELKKLYKSGGRDLCLSGQDAGNAV